MKIGDKIRITRKINKITINDLANFLGISAPTLRKIESNELKIKELESKIKSLTESVETLSSKLEKETNEKYHLTQKTQTAQQAQT